MFLRLKFLFVVCSCYTLMSCAQSHKKITPETYVAYKTLDPITIDGDDADSAWKHVKWSNPFIDIEGNKTPKYKTEVKMLWDDTYFYILAKLDEPHVWGDLKQRDTIIFYNNDFEVFIDPDGDTHNYYELEINALNTVWDLFLSKPYREPDNVVLNDWTLTGLKSAVKVHGTLNNPKDTDKGWTLEIAIPWSAYKISYFDKNVPEDAFWRVNFSRVNWQHTITNGIYARKKDDKDKFLPEYNWVWSPMGVINMHEPEKWGYVYFSSKTSNNKDTFVIPNDEKIKWELYRLYRAQKDFYKTHQIWAASLDSLTEPVIHVQDKTIIPELTNHTTGFNIEVKSPFSNKTIIIKEDGKIISK